MPTYRLTVEYEGTRYRGWQEQKNARTVAGELRRALEETLGEAIDLGGAGRTDAGVHALAQTAHLRCRTAADPGELIFRVNEALPPDINLLGLVPAPREFHARHSAVSRSYLYQISRRRTAFAKRHVWWVRARLDGERLAREAQAAVGRHDFARLAERAAAQDSTEVVVEQVRVAEAGELLLIRIVASHFLWKMVRRLVGTLVRVGAGALPAGTLAGLLAEDPALARLNSAEWTAPPSGLFLERVLYAGDPPLGPLRAATPVGESPGR
jgi:tRNA pseudouridine38-40 synthase